MTIVDIMAVHISAPTVTIYVAPMFGDVIAPAVRLATLNLN